MGNDPPYGETKPAPDDAYRIDLGSSAWVADPLTRKAASEIRNLHAPLWNANIGSGMPLAADMQSAAFNVLRFIPGQTGSALIWDIYLVGRYLLAGVLTYLFCRKRGLSLPAGVGTAVAFIFSGFFMVFSNAHWVDVYFSLPLILLGVEALLVRVSPGRMALLTAGVAFNLLAGMPESSFLTILFAAGYAVFRAIDLSWSQRNWRQALSRTSWLGLGFIGGFAIAMPVLLPFAEYQAHAFTIHTSERQLGAQVLPVRWAEAFLVPYLRGVGRAGDFDAGLRAFGGYVGLVVGFLAVLGITRIRVHKEAGFMLVAALLGLGKVYGLPGLVVFGHLPLFKVIYYIKWMAPVVAFSFAYLAGLGIDYIARERRIGAPLHLCTSAASAQVPVRQATRLLPMRLTFS